MQRWRELTQREPVPLRCHPWCTAVFVISGGAMFVVVSELASTPNWGRALLLAGAFIWTCLWALSVFLLERHAVTSRDGG